MDHDRLAKSDFVSLAILAGVCLLLGTYLIVSRPLMSPDGVFYIEQARRVIHDPLTVTRRYPPGYPLLVWAAHALAKQFVAGDSPLLWVRAGQSVTLLCRVLALVPLYFLGKRLVGPRHGFQALLLLVMLPYPAYYGSDVLRDWPYVLLLSLGFWMLYRGLQEGTWWPFAVAGPAAGLGYLIRPECAQLLIYGACGLLLVARRPYWGALDPDGLWLPEEDGKDGTLRGRQGRPAAPASATAIDSQVSRASFVRCRVAASKPKALGMALPWGAQDHRQAALDAATQKIGIRNLRVKNGRRTPAWCGAGLLLVAGFALPAAPYLRAVGTIVPQQLSASPAQEPPVVLQVGSRPAGNVPLEFEVRAGELLEVPIEAFDPEDQPLMFSLAGVPAGSRPVYQFRSVATGACFWTLSEDERSMLLTRAGPQVWQYDGIVCYAYPQPDPQAGLQAVHRFWSAARQRHFYTLSESEEEAFRQVPAPADPVRQEADWQYEGVVFYAFPAGHHPPDAVPVYRRGSEVGIADFGFRIADSRPAVQQSSGAGTNPQSAIINPQSSEVVWYVRGAGQPPAGARVEHQVLRWQPRPEQQGEHWINVIISDGRSSTCQLVLVRVQPPLTGGENQPAGPAETRGPSRDAPAPGGGNSKFEARNPQQIQNANDQNTVGAQVPFQVLNLRHSCLFRISRFEFRALNSPRPASGRQYAGVARLPKAVDQLFDALAEDLMVVFLVPWLLGLYYRLRYQAGRTERVLVLALLLVNVAAMLARYAWVAPGANRRYSLGLLALTIFYVPVGLQIMGGWLASIADWRVRTMRQTNPQSAIHNPQSLLLAIGLGACIFRLCMAPTVDKSSYRMVARWLQANTASDAVVAVPDTRISFYADRPAVSYRRQFDPRRVAYAVRVEGQDRPAAPADWRRAYSIPFNRGKGGQTVVVYQIEQAQQ